MTRSIAALVRENPPTVLESDTVAVALARFLDSDLSALPVTDAGGRCTGIFGEREFIAALFPGYVGELSTAAFVSRALDEHLETRAECLEEPVSKYMNSEPIAVPEDFSYMQVAETFVHHRARVLPVIGKDERLAGVISRRDFARTLAARLIEKR